MSKVRVASAASNGGVEQTAFPGPRSIDSIAAMKCWWFHGGDGGIHPNHGRNANGRAVKTSVSCRVVVVDWSSES